MVVDLINRELDALDDKQPMTSTINQFTDNIVIVQNKEKSHQKEKRKVHTSTKLFTIEEQADNQVSSNEDLSDNMSTKEKESPRKQGNDLYILLIRIILHQNHLKKISMI